MKVIEQAQTEWAVPIFFAAKKDSFLRFFIEYRRLNEVSVRDAYQILRME